MRGPGSIAILPAAPLCLAFLLVTVPGMLGWVEPASGLFLCLAQDTPAFAGGCLCVSAQHRHPVHQPFLQGWIWSSPHPARVQLELLAPIACEAGSSEGLNTIKLV